MHAAVTIQQPHPNDIVGALVHVAGLATGHEATLGARVRDGEGHELVATYFMAGGGLGEIGQYHVAMELPATPTTPNGFVEVWEPNEAYPDEGPYDGPVAEVNKVVVPVVFGTHLVSGFVGFTTRMVVDGDTLTSIAAAEYADGAHWPAIYEANRHQIGDPDLIHSGLELRIPQRFAPVATSLVDVYFLNQDRFAAATEPYVEAVQRTVPAAMPAAGALQALFAGPTAAERARSLAVVLSQATGFVDLTIADQIARVRLTGGCNSGGSTFSIYDLIAPTLKQFASVDYVKVLAPDGETGTPDGPHDSMPACLNP